MSLRESFKDIIEYLTLEPSVGQFTTHAILSFFILYHINLIQNLR